MTKFELIALFSLPPEKAILFLKSKGYKITKSWRELLDSAHAKAFTVAHCAKLDILKDIRTELQKALDQGQTLEWFKENLMPILQKKGWVGTKIDKKLSGENRAIELGTPRRLETIYRTNMQSVYQAARWQQQQEVKDTHPYLQYLAVGDAKTRPAHAAMNGKVFRADDPIWNTCYPPNGFNCRCVVRAISNPSLKREGLTVEKAKLEPVKINAGNGEKAKVIGVKTTDESGKPVTFTPDYGFNANMGKDWLKTFKQNTKDNSP